jgi:ketosteroid isomerase-like protein
MTDAEATLAVRLDRIESHLAIQQLPARYALALDARDVDTLVELFVPDVVVGGPADGVGRPALREFFTANLSHFYRSMHLISGHVIDFDDTDHARGVVYCRAEHEDAGRWGIMVMNYKDTYARVDGRWLFVRRRLQPLYTCDITERPSGPDFNGGWGGGGLRDESTQTWPARLPAEHATFAAFWAQFDREHVARLTIAPVEGEDR